MGDTHTIRYNDGSKADLAINATQLSTGVTPEGSTWRRNPIPACNCDIGGYGCTVDGKGFDKAYANNPDPISSEVCKTGTMYPAGFKNGAGGVGYLTGSPVHYSIVDQVQVPSEEGEYVLQWRWDCEETAQVWNSCADIKVSSTEPPTPFPAPAPPAPPGPPPKPKPPTPGKGGCKKGENPTCKGVSPGAASKACYTYVRRHRGLEPPCTATRPRCCQYSPPPPALVRRGAPSATTRRRTTATSAATRAIASTPTPRRSTTAPPRRSTRSATTWSSSSERRCRRLRAARSCRLGAACSAAPRVYFIGVAP